jgi:hypothetical protein
MSGKLICSNCGYRFDGPVVLTPSQAAETTDATVKCPICRVGILHDDSDSGTVLDVCDPRVVTEINAGRVTRPI